MVDDPQETILRAGDWGYENIEGRSGRCDQYVIFNRATDLENASFAGGRRVKCSSCGATIRLGGDTGSHPIDLILFDAYNLRLQRRYMFGVLALAQALEVTLAECARFVFVQRPLEASTHLKNPTGPELLDVFEEKIRNMTLQPFRNLMLRFATNGIAPADRAEAAELVLRIHELARGTPSDVAIEAIADVGIRTAMSNLKRATIGSMRNDVAHHFGKRPTQQEFESQYEQVEQLIRSLLKVFGITPSGGQRVVSGIYDEIR